MTLVTINTSRIDESNAIVEAFASQVCNPLLTRAEFRTALVAFLHNVAAPATAQTTDTDVEMTSIDNYTTSTKKRKRIDMAQQQPVVQLLPELTIPLPVAARQGARTADYTIIPQHVILYIFEFREGHLDEDDVSSLFCRFRNQTCDRQYFLQYRSLTCYDVQFVELEQQKLLAFKFLMLQTVHLTLYLTDSWHKAAPLFTKEYWPKLKTVHLDVDEDGFESVICSANNHRYLCERIVELDVDIPLGSAPQTQVVVARMVRMLPQLKRLGRLELASLAIKELANARHLSSVSISDCSEEDALEVIKAVRQLESLQLVGPETPVVWNRFPAAVSKLTTNIKSLSIASLPTVPLIPSLTKLDICCEVSSFDFSDIHTLPRLRFLKLDSKWRQKFDSCYQVQECKALTHLTLEFTQLDVFPSAITIAVFELNQRGQLLELTLENFVTREDKLPLVYLNGLGIGERCALRSLHIQGFSIEDSEVSAASCIQSCKYLEHIIMNGLQTSVYYDSRDRS